MDNTKPYLKPSDLEDIANIFDRIRVLYKKKDDSGTQPAQQVNARSKKLIAKCHTQLKKDLDPLALEFDARLTHIMQDLSKQLRNPVYSDTQKWNCIERSKFELYNYCNETATQFLTKNKNHILIKDAKELTMIFNRITEGMFRCFNNQTCLLFQK